MRAFVVAISVLVGGLAASRSSGRAQGAPAATEASLVDAAPTAAAVILNHVSDGDTLNVTYLGKRERIRLIGIDSPEAFDDEKAHRDSAKTGERINSILKKGARSKTYLENLLQSDQKLRVVFDQEKRDRYHRLLGYVYLPSGELLNVKIVRDGFAKPKAIGVNRKHQSEIEAAYDDAKRSKRGLWGG